MIAIDDSFVAAMLIFAFAMIWVIAIGAVSMLNDEDRT